MVQYSQIYDADLNHVSNFCVQRSDGIIVQFKENDPNYPDYLKWLSQGNVPLKPIEEELNG